MILTNGSTIIIPLEMKDGNERIRVAEVMSLTIKLYTIDKNKFVKFDLDDISQLEDYDEIEVNPLYMDALDSGVIQYQYIYSYDGRVKKVGNTVTDFYWKNLEQKNLPLDENGISAVSETKFNQFVTETNFNVESLNDRINVIAEIADNHVDKQDNSVVYDYKDNIVINELYIDETEEKDAEIYWKDEVDELIQDTKDYADEKVEGLKEDIENEGYAHLTDIPDVSIYLTEHQDLSEYQKISEADGKYQPKGQYLTVHQSIEHLATKEELNALTPDLSNYYTKDEAERTFLSEHQSLRDYLSESEIDRLYATKEYVQEMVADATDIDLSPYIGRAEVISMLNGYEKKEDVKPIPVATESEVRQALNASRGNISEILEEILS